MPKRSVVLAAGVDMTFNFVPPGTFLMGSPEGEEGHKDDEFLHRVTLTKGFWMGVYPVTQAQWQALMGSNPSEYRGDNRPVEMVSWDDCQGFCSKLAETTGLRFVLPSEAEWEYACRAGTTTAYYTGDGLEAVKRAVWCCYLENGKGVRAEETKLVGQFKPNAWGLFDLHGNVWEWMADEIQPEPPIISRKFEGAARRMRGGCWYTHPRPCRSAHWVWVPHDYHTSCVGCRVVFCPDE